MTNTHEHMMSGFQWTLITSHQQDETERLNGQARRQRLNTSQRETFEYTSNSNKLTLCINKTRFLNEPTEDLTMLRRFISVINTAIGNNDSHTAPDHTFNMGKSA